MSSPQEEVVRELSSQLVEEMAPDELQLFEAFWVERQSPRNVGSRVHQDPLSFGVSEAMAVLTPAVIQATLAVVDIIWNEAKVALGGAANDYLSELRARLKNSRQAKSGTLKAPSETVAENGLSRELLRKVQKLAASIAIREGIDERTAEALSIKLVGKLALQQ